MKALVHSGPDGARYVEYECPGCAASPLNCAGRHTIPYGGGKWEFNGDVERPTISPSVLSNVGGASPSAPICHHFVRDGQIQYLSDCTHPLAGQTMELPNIEN